MILALDFFYGSPTSELHPSSGAALLPARPESYSSRFYERADTLSQFSLPGGQALLLYMFAILSEETDFESPLQALPPLPPPCQG